MSAEIECAQDQQYQAESDSSDASPKLQIYEGEEKKEEPQPMVFAETPQLEMGKEKTGVEGLVGA